MESTQKQANDVYEDVIRTLSELAPASLNTAELQDLLGGDVRRRDIYAACDKGLQAGLLDQDVQSMPYRFSYKGAAPAQSAESSAEAQPVLAEAMPSGAVAPAATPPAETSATPVAAEAATPAETPPTPTGRAVRKARPAAPAEKPKRRGKSEKLAAAIRAQVGKPKQQAGKMMLQLLQQTGEHLNVDELRDRLGLLGSNDSLFKSLRILIDKGEVQREESIWPQTFYATHPAKAVAAVRTTASRPAAARPQPATTVPLRPAVAAPVAAVEPEAAPVAPAVAPAAPAAVATQAIPPRFNAQLDWDGQLHLNINGHEAVLDADEARRLVRLVVSYHGQDFLQRQPNP